MGKGWMGVGHSGGVSVHPYGGGGSLVELCVGGDNPVSWGRIEFGDEIWEGKCSCGVLSKIWGRYEYGAFSDQERLSFRWQPIHGGEVD